MRVEGSLNLGLVKSSECFMIICGWIKKPSTVFKRQLLSPYNVWAVDTEEHWKKELNLSQTASTLEKNKYQALVVGLDISAKMVLTFPGFSTSSWLVKYESKGSHMSKMRLIALQKESHLVFQCLRMLLKSTQQNRQILSRIQSCSHCFWNDRKYQQASHQPLGVRF